MKQVGKYNLYKGISTAMTVGTPVATLALCGTSFINEPKASLSASAVFGILIAMLFLKDKIAEKWKMPSAFIISTIVLILVIIAENLMTPIKITCITTMVMSGVDELTFKRMYKNIEVCLPENYKTNQFAGFIMTTTDKLVEQAKQIKELNGEQQ